MCVSDFNCIVHDLIFVMLNGLQSEAVHAVPMTYGYKKILHWSGTLEGSFGTFSLGTYWSHIPMESHILS